ncbi:MAG: 4Fe-4S binding protein [Chloroflexi bacterium]|nr:4Fe-4S binding protein [Chloroflexota bacterium]
MDLAIVGDLLRLTVLGGLGVAGILAVLIWKKNMSTRITFLRFVIQAVSFAAIFYIFTYTIPLLYVLIILLAMTLFIGKFYCGWLCPFAFIMDIESLVRKAFKKRYRIIPDKLNKSLHQLRYVLLLFFLLTPIALWFLEPPPDTNFAILMVQVLAGPFRPYSIILAPLIPLIVSWTTAPLIINGINFSYPYVQDIITWAGTDIGQTISVVFVGLTLVGSFFIRRLWCRFCPTGVSLAVVNRFKGFKWAPMLHIDKDEEKCTKCGVCKRVCPVQVTEVYEQKGGKIKTSQCMLCARCVEMCPYESTLKVKLGNKTLFKSRNWLEQSKSE